MRPTMRPTVPDRPPEPTGSRPAPDQMRSSVQPSQILHAIRRNLVACLVILLVCILAGLGVALATKPVAAATTTLGIQPKSKETPSFSTQAKDLMPTLVELSTSPKVASYHQRRWHRGAYLPCRIHRRSPSPALPRDRYPLHRCRRAHGDGACAPGGLPHPRSEDPRP